MTQTNNQGVEEVFILRDQLHQIDMEEDSQVLQEFRYQDQHYVLLRSKNDPPCDCSLYRVSGSQLEEIEDEMEWESVSEAIDEYLFTRYS